MSTVETGALDEGRAGFERHDWEKAYELLSAADSAVPLKRLSEPVRLARIGWR